MIHERNFQSAVFILSYRGQGVARIRYKMMGALASLPADIANTTLNANETLPRSNTTTRLLQPSTDANTTSVDTVDPQNDPLLRVAFRLVGSVITIYDIFYLALGMLREVAPYPRTARLVDTTTPISAANLLLSTRQNNPQRTVQNPPYFQVEWLMKALARTPAYMLEQRSFRELEMTLFVDEVKVGEISIMRPRSGNALVLGSGDVLAS